ncbi:MAG: ABC transporter ATP-binding protein [Vicinamibacterales bacterium]|nr:ABC transporter ATP-binding protein [Vicinamibacterales bacterium]
MLRADNVTFGYGPDTRGQSPFAGPAQRAGAGDVSGAALVLDGVSLAIPSGGLVGILGPNGSGKTTLLRLLSGTLRPSSGRVWLDDTAVDALSRRDLARRIAVVPQETHLSFDYSVMEMVLMGRHPHLGLFEVEGPRDLAIARDALAATGTGHLEARQFDTLSGGEKQRVVIAAALAQAAGLLLLDEPTASLDLGYQLEVAGLLHHLNEDRGVTLVVSTHDLNLAASLCRHLILLHKGRVLAAGATEEVLTSEHIQTLYGVEADVRVHDETGHLTVVPIRRRARR